jgi:hypothetical protein
VCEVLRSARRVWACAKRKMDRRKENTIEQAAPAAPRDPHIAFITRCSRVLEIEILILG